MSAATRIKAQQLQWARRAGLKPDAKGYVRRIDDNLRSPLRPETRKDFERGSGDELHDHGKRPAKMRALYSSAALACNFFDFWRDRDTGVLAQALGLDAAIAKLSFEMQLPTGLPGTPPNLDLFLTLQSGVYVAIESKFTELYATRRKAAPFKPKYFPKGCGVWAAALLPNCQQLATDLRRKRASFPHLDTAQLLKHALGLATQHPGRGTLLYLYYDDNGPEGAQHRTELSRFTESLGGELGFRGLSYQDLLARLMPLDIPDGSSYKTYLSERYASNSA